MKKIGLNLLVAVFLFKSLSAQRECGSHFDPTVVQTVDVNRYNRFMQLEQHISNFKNSTAARLINPNGLIIIPVVFHVLHNNEAIGSGKNLSFAQLKSQIDVLNEDFRRLNADRVNTPTNFLPVAADINIEFRLACFDPNGNITYDANGNIITGINRISTSQTVFYHSNPGKVKHSNTGGADAWPTDKYLNIWTCNVFTPVSGYATEPFDYATNPNEDGVVLHYQNVGNVGNNLTGYGKGRVGTHEVGHWLDLFHIAGDGQFGGCLDSDYCDDTPNQEIGNYSCTPKSSCSNTGDMYMNYMDYTNDDCRNLFTNDQKSRMRAVFATVNGVPGPRQPFLNNYFSFQGQSTSMNCKGKITVSPMCLPVSWTVTGPAFISSGNGTSQIELTATGNGTVHLVATSGNYTDEMDIAVTKNLPVAPTGISIYQQICGNGVQWWFDPLVWNPVNKVYHWTFTGNNGTPSIASGESVTAPIWMQFYTCNAAATLDITVKAENECGFSSTYIQTLGNPCGGCGGNEDETFRISTSPNPAKNEITVSVSGKTKMLKQTSIFKPIRIKLIDLYSGLEVKQWSYSRGQSNYRLDISNVKAGMYVIEMTHGHQKVTGRILIEGK